MDDFLKLLKKNGVHHRVATPYHPQTNGFILRSTQQEEALHRIWYTLRREREKEKKRKLRELQCHYY
ncbi:unnamed protein product [Spirodela intermedia]|uniref:Uncharacterized protein n=1 Tax=Spirodela intermedia TaxID=51605 RepID=A0A7I8JE40_SPIIN|nr:unnamed protein product [Spirodela intermedia]CAA6668420.1 unnamed protein product [Spirodela intermedia]